MNRIATLSAVLILALPGCSTINGEPAQLNNAGKILAAAVIVGGLIALAANQERKPDAVIQTTGPSGTTTSNVYIK